MKATVLKPMQKTSTRDNIGNRISSEDSGQTTEYQANNLNQYSQTTINSTTNNFSFDPDGNMLTNGEWTYTWNGENRMVLASNASHVVTFAYDYRGRCYEKVKAPSGVGTSAATNSYVWDDFNIVTEISSAHKNQNVWGLDLSGSLQGAGGVGGLLATAQDGAIYFTAFDANGNICQYVDASGTTVANREYSPFGKSIALTGSKKDDFTHWFSTKPWDADAEMSEYEYRKYLAEMGRWASRDPIENIGLNYLYVWNNPLVVWDYLGNSPAAGRGPYGGAAGGWGHNPQPSGGTGNFSFGFLMATHAIEIDPNGCVYYVIYFTPTKLLSGGAGMSAGPSSPVSFDIGGVSVNTAGGSGASLSGGMELPFGVSVEAARVPITPTDKDGCPCP